MTEAYSLFSGSSGNCTFIKSGSTSILVDAGKNTSCIVKALKTLGAELGDISAIFITHAHGDHVSALPVLLKKYTGKVYSSFDTFYHLTKNGIDGERLSHFEFGETVEIDDIKIKTYPTPHDITGSTCYRFECADRTKIAVATDIGYVSDAVFDCLFGADYALIESNHDVKMLKNGPYPRFLKERVMGSGGHLSNDACAHVLPRLAAAGTKKFVLAHLSGENNDPVTARRAAEAALVGSNSQIAVALCSEIVEICKR